MRAFLPALPAFAACLLAAGRWWRQGSGNLYTTLSRGAYVPDPLLRWRFEPEGPIWLGLDAVGALLGVALVLGAGAWLCANKDRFARLRAPLWIASLATLAVPLAALSSGTLPAGARVTLPEREQATPTAGIEAHLPALAAGRYVVRAGGTLGAVVATVSAGGEAFETRFSGWEGELDGDPSDLSAPLNVRVQIDPATADTGVELRSKHATEYLQAEAHPQIRLDVERLDATERSADGTVGFAATGSLAFMGETLTLPLTGELQALDAARLREHGVAEAQALLVSANFSIPIAQTPLRSDAGDFSAEQIPVSVTLLFTPTDE